VSILVLIINYTNILEMPPKQVPAAATPRRRRQSSNDTIILDITPQAPKAVQTPKTRKRKVDYYTLYYFSI
jgi:hypothetical protein